MQINDTETLKTDVIIVGAGPAGVSAAMELIDHNINFIIIDKEKFPRRKVCAGGLMGHIVAEFPWVEPFIDSYIYKVRVVSPNLRDEFIIDTSATQKYIMGMSKSRTDFDHKLLLHLKEVLKSKANPHTDTNTDTNIGSMQNSMIIEGDPVISAGYLNNGESNSREYVYVKTKSGRTIIGNIIIGADGAYSSIAKIFGIGLFGVGKKFNKEVELGLALEKEIRYYDNKTREENPRDDLKERFMVHLLLQFGGIHGYAWHFPRSIGTNLGVGGLAFEAKNLKKAYYELEDYMLKLKYLDPEILNINKLKEDSDPALKLRGAILPATLPYKDLTAKGVLLVGDAGGFCSAATGEGIYYALKTGKLAAQTIIELFNKTEPPNHHNEGTWGDNSPDNALHSRIITKKHLKLYYKKLKKKIMKELKFQYFAKNYVLIDERRARKAVRWAIHDEKLRKLFTGFLIGKQNYKHILLKLFYHYVRCKILDKLNKLGDKSEEEALKKAKKVAGIRNTT
ncbi:MAG: FAD-dependent monooxygenase [Promethearchaeota archaeon]